MICVASVFGEKEGRGQKRGMKREGEGTEGNIFHKSLKKMLTKSCVMFLSPSRAVLSNVVVNNWCNSTSS